MAGKWQLKVEIIFFDKKARQERGLMEGMGSGKDNGRGESWE